jgi:membrane-associated protease RseP (regulator of RpoE activity)
MSKNSYTITLSEKNNRAFLGIGIIPPSSPRFFSFFYKFIQKIKDPSLFYSSKIGNFGIFIGDLLWWIVIASFSVALMNMLPAGIFDGGRFFYLTILGITGSKKVAEKAFKLSTYILLILLGMLLIKWIWAFSFG